jgi:hypothetical protein
MGKEIDTSTHTIRRGSGHGTSQKVMRATWETPLGWSGSSIAAAMRTRWESERVVVLEKPGNAGGGKDPCFRRAFEEVEER